MHLEILWELTPPDGVRYAVGAFGTNGGVSQEFNCLLTELFTGYDKQFVGKDTAITTQLQYVQQCIRATIIKTQAEVIQSNMLYAYRSMGYDDDCVAWMQGENRVVDAEPVLMEEAPPMDETFVVYASDDEEVEVDEEESAEGERKVAAVIGHVRPAAAPGWQMVGRSANGGGRGAGKAGGAAAAAGGQTRRGFPAIQRSGRGMAVSHGQGGAGRAGGRQAVARRGGGWAGGQVAQRRYGVTYTGDPRARRDGKGAGAAGE